MDEMRGPIALCPSSHVQYMPNGQSLTAEPKLRDISRSNFFEKVFGYCALTSQEGYNIRHRYVLLVQARTRLATRFVITTLTTTDPLESTARYLFLTNGLLEYVI